MDLTAMDATDKQVDPVTFEILSHRLHEITREMGATLERVGGTVNTTQLHDYMASLYMANGDVLSVGESMIRHAACAGFAVKRIIERFEGNGGIYPGDVFLLNDPYLAAIHQSDIYTIAPIHYQDRLMGWSATFVHVMDIGAMSPGGNSPGATEICHEGLRIPGLKLVERGRLRQDVFDTLINMTRQPVLVGLDLKCELAANNVARARMEEMFAQYGPELITAVSSEMIRYSGAVLRRRLREIPDGTWQDSGTIAANETRRVCVELRKRGDQLVFDFTGSDPQARQGINLPLPRHLRRVLRGRAHRPGLRPAQELRRLRPHRGHRPGGDGGERAVSRAGVHEHHLGAQDRFLRGRLDVGADAGG